ncbi:hypothetical protein V6N12_052894 [Hibiscus sabdariffa]|uniref:Uncharacterized protein n=1 Tax=Hibiscus sabdariffa TaxID=183260 RepID=A0ABR2C2X6_9ROSI
MLQYQWCTPRSDSDRPIPARRQKLSVLLQARSFQTARNAKRLTGAESGRQIKLHGAKAHSPVPAVHFTVGR